MMKNPFLRSFALVISVDLAMASCGTLAQRAPESQDSPLQPIISLSEKESAVVLQDAQPLPHTQTVQAESFRHLMESKNALIALHQALKQHLDTLQAGVARESHQRGWQHSVVPDISALQDLMIREHVPYFALTLGEISKQKRLLQLMHQRLKMLPDVNTKTDVLEVLNAIEVHLDHYQALLENYEKEFGRVELDSSAFR